MVPIKFNLYEVTKLSEYPGKSEKMKLVSLAFTTLNYTKTIVIKIKCDTDTNRL